MGTLLLSPEIETPHLTLREMSAKDVRDLSGFMTQPRYQRHISYKLKDETAVSDFVHRQIAAQRDQRRQVYHLAAEEKLSGEVIGEGFVILHAGKDCEIGWGVHPAMWSMGLGGEIGKALLALGFERMNLKSLWCKVMLANGASLSVARRIGMKQAAEAERYPVGNGRFQPVAVFRLSASEYFELPY